MVYAKRVAIATILGVIAGFVCYAGMKSGGRIELTTAMTASTILNRTLIGFVIGISAWKIHYLLHGIVIGFIVSLPIAVYADIGGFAMLMAAGAVYGFIIELLTTKALKSPIRE